MPKVPRQSTRQSKRTDPMARATNPPTFTCTACMDDIPGPAALVNDAPFCEPCFTNGIKPQFQQALRDETQYPVKSGGQEVKLDSTLARFFTKQFLRDWAAKVKEYATPVAERLYCAGECEEFLGPKTRHRSTKSCGKCGTRMCADCGGSVGKEHECKPPADETDAFEGMVRGRDYQTCPLCSAPVMIGSGCNHMICPIQSCSTEFCYICGELAREGQNHWDFGKPCPKYNQPGADNAQYEDEIPPGRVFEDRTMMLINEGMLRTTTEGFAEADAPREIRVRNSDRMHLHRIYHEAMDDIVALRDDGSADVAHAVGGISLLANALMGSMDVTTLHLDPDAESRRQRWRELRTVHRLVLEWILDTGEAGFDRYSQMAERLHVYLRAYGMRLVDELVHGRV